MSRLLSYFLVFVATIVLVLSLFLWLHVTKTFRIHQVWVVCHPMILDRDQLEEMLTPFAQKEFFAVDIREIQGVLQGLPEIARVEVRRIWPDKIVLKLQLSRPVAYWNREGFLNPYGELFSSHLFSLVDLDLPVFFNDVDHRVKMLDYYQQMNAVIQNLGVKIRQISLDLKQGWRIQLDNGLKLKLGRENIIDKMQHFAKKYPKIFSADRVKKVEEIDCRYAHGMAVRWKR